MALEKRSQWIAAEFRCAHHAAEGAIALPAVVAVRRVGIALHVDLVGGFWEDSLARAEAVGRVERALAELGAEWTVLEVTSELGRIRLWPDLQTTTASGGAP